MSTIHHKMSKLIITLVLFLSTFTATELQSCSIIGFDFPDAICNYDQESVFTGRVVQQGQNYADIQILERHRGCETPTTIRIWDGEIIDCNGPFMAPAIELGEIGDSVIFLAQKIDTLINPWDRIGDYRRPIQFGLQGYKRIVNGSVEFQQVTIDGEIGRYDEVSSDVVWDIITTKTTYEEFLRILSADYCLDNAINCGADDALFEDYPWLADLIDQNACTTEQVELYESGIYQYLLVTNANGDSKLYNQNGQFYCQHSATYDCVAAYNLGTPTATWSCSGSTNKSCLLEETIVDRLINWEFENPLCRRTTGIYRIDYEGLVYYYFTADYLDPSCNEGGIYDCNLELVCAGPISTAAIPLPNISPLCKELEGGDFNLIWSLDGTSTDSCTVTISSRNCKDISIFDENDRWLHSLNPGPVVFPGFPNGRPFESWEDDRPLADGETRTYVFKLGRLIIGRQTASCTNAAIEIPYEYTLAADFEVTLNDFLGCTDVSDNSILSNVGCVNLRVINSFGILQHTIAPGDSLFFTETGEIHILMAGQDTLGISDSGFGRKEIDTGGCTNNPNESNSLIFIDYPWLTGLVDPNNCSSETVAVYQQGIELYVLVTYADGRVFLYNQQGQLICRNSNSDCVTAFNLEGPITSWTCGEPMEDCNTQDPFSLPNIQKAINSWPYGNSDGLVCWFIDRVVQFQYQGAIYYMVVEGVNNFPRCTSESGNTFYDCEGMRVGGTGFNFCPDQALCSALLEAAISSGKVIWKSGFSPGSNEDNCFCPELDQPVCGVDGFRYKNNCEAACAGVAVLSESSLEGCSESSPCTIIITNKQCREIGVYDEDDNLLTTIAKGPYPTTPLPHTPSQWTDPRPLAANATRTYVFKENILILGRQTVSCDNPNIDVVSNQNSGCTDAFGSTELTNIGCRTIQVVNSSGNVIKTAAPGEVFTLADGPLRVFLAGNDTLSVRNIVGTLTINSGGCEETTAPIFNDYPWLTDLVNPTGCSTEKVAVYQQGIYFFLLVTDASGDSKLYNQNGQFYCQHTATYDCVAAYNLGAPVDSWTCSDTPSGDCLTDEEMIQRLRASDFGEACPTTKITKIEYNGNTYYTYTIGSDPNSNTPCTLQDFGGATVDCKGESICVYSIFFDDPPICNELNNGVKTEIWSIDTTCSCTGEVDPVCGENGRTYINPCEARCAGVEVASQSPCVQNGGIRETITVCRGESVFLNAPPRVVGCLATLTPFSIAIEPTTGAVPRERDGFTITPTQSGTYSVTSVGVCNTNADVGMPGQGTIGAQNPLSLVDVFTTNIYEVIVEDCGNTPALFTDYPWLTDLINPNTCTRGRIELYQSGIYFYLRVNTGDGFAKLYNQNGQFYCQESANYNCVEAYRLGAPIDSWTCQGNVACPQVYIPVCGLDGRTYGSGCDANQQGVQVAYFGECNPATAPCEQYKGRVVTVGCGTYIQVPIQPTPPFGSSVNYFELSAFTDGILPVAGDSIKFSFLPTGIQNESCLSSLVPYVAGNMDCYEIIEQGNDCNQFRGTVLQNACGNLLLKVEEQRIFPTFASGVRPPRPGEIIEFNFNQAVETSVINCEGKTTQVLLGTVECFTVVDGIVCTQVPVCGVDGNTYGNACAAIIADVEIDPTGAACDPNRPCDFNYEGIVIVSDCDAQSSDPILQLEDGTNIAAAFSGSANFTGQAGDRLRVRMDIDIREDQMVNCAVPAVIGLITCFEVLEELPCGQYTGIYSLDECGNPLVRSTQSDGSTLLFAPAIPSAVILSDGAMIRFNILGEEESTLTCEGQERQVILGIASCVEIIEEMTNAICDDILVELVEDQFIISDNPNIPGSPELLMSGMLEFDNTDNSGGGFGIRLCNSLRCALPITLDAVNLEGSTVETYRLMLRTVNNESCRYTIENPEATESACNTTGTIFFDNCDNGQLYYFVITEDGKVYDPYFDRSITYTPVDGERVKFDFVDASFPSPCSIAEKAITITCLEVIERTPFEKYPFLVEAFNQYGCSTVEVFDQGSYDFIFLRQNANRGRLYLDNGTFYCETTPTYDCIAAYGLGSPTSTFNCNNLNTEESEERASTSSVQLNFTAFPNPTADRLTVQLPTASNREYQLYIHDMLGRRLYQSEVDQTAVSVELDMADYENGVYYIELRAAGMRGIKKVVKQGLE